MFKKSILLACGILNYKGWTFILRTNFGNSYRVWFRPINIVAFHLLFLSFPTWVNDKLGKINLSLPPSLYIYIHIFDRMKVFRITILIHFKYIFYLKKIKLLSVFWFIFKYFKMKNILKKIHWTTISNTWK